MIHAIIGVAELKLESARQQHQLVVVIHAIIGVAELKLAAPVRLVEGRGGG